MIRVILRVTPKRTGVADIPVVQSIDLDAEYYVVEDVIDWVNTAIEENIVAEFLRENGQTFSLDPDLYDRISVEVTP